MGFDWQNEHHKNNRSLLSHVITEVIDNKDIERLSELTDGFTNIDFTIELNGFRYDGENFFRRLDESIDKEIERRTTKGTVEDIRTEVSVIADAVRAINHLLGDEV